MKTQSKILAIFKVKETTKKQMFFFFFLFSDHDQDCCIHVMPIELFGKQMEIFLGIQNFCWLVTPMKEGQLGRKSYAIS